MQHLVKNGTLWANFELNLEVTVAPRRHVACSPVRGPERNDSDKLSLGSWCQKP